MCWIFLRKKVRTKRGLQLKENQSNPSFDRSLYITLKIILKKLTFALNDKKAFILFLISLFISIFYFALNPQFNQNINEESFNDFDVTIHRDRFGVHIIGKRCDKDTAYGLAYAHAEDFETIQDMMLFARANWQAKKAEKWPQ